MFLLFRYAADSPIGETHDTGVTLLEIMSNCEPYTERSISCQTLVQITHWIHQLLHAVSCTAAAAERSFPAMLASVFWGSIRAMRQQPVRIAGAREHGSEAVLPQP